MSRYQCNGCGYVYDEAKGNAHEGFPPGTRWASIPEQWCCPDCGVREKPDFAKLDEPAAQPADRAGTR
jgi:rubredoxin